MEELVIHDSGALADHFTKVMAGQIPIGLTDLDFGCSTTWVVATIAMVEVVIHLLPWHYGCLCNFE